MISVSSRFGSHDNEHTDADTALALCDVSGRILRLKMFYFYFDAAPFLAEILSDEAPVTVVGLMLAAKEASVIEKFGLEPFFDFSGNHEIAE